VMIFFALLTAVSAYDDNTLCRLSPIGDI